MRLETGMMITSLHRSPDHHRNQPQHLHVRVSLMPYFLMSRECSASLFVVSSPSLPLWVSSCLTSLGTRKAISSWNLIPKMTHQQNQEKPGPLFKIRVVEILGSLLAAAFCTSSSWSLLLELFQKMAYLCDCHPHQCFYDATSDMFTSAHPQHYTV